MTGCWFASLPDAGPCDGRLVKAHLIPRQLLKREGRADLIDDPRTWVPGCGGITGCSGHHGMLDYSRTLRIPRSLLPAAVEEVAEEAGLGWWIDRTYPPDEARVAA
jgi:hypothetical protein